MNAFSTSIVLVNYNSLQDTVECVGSIQKSNCELPWIVVVDNNSRDKDTIEEELSFYPFIKVILTDENIGFGRANNVGLDWIKDNLNCKYIFLLNNDTIIEENTLSVLQNTFAECESDVGMVAPKILVYNKPHEIWYQGGIINYKKMTPDIGMSQSVYTDFASGCAMFFDSSVLYEMKGFDPFFFMYDEDVELCLRLTNSGKKIRFVENAVVHHKCQGSQTKKEDIPSNQLHPNHPSLLFYLGNTITNRRYIINKHLAGKERQKATNWQKKYWILKSIQFLLYGKPKAFQNVLKHLFVGPLSCK